MKPKRKPFVITTGDVDGIGLEVTLKALAKISSSNRFLIFCSDKEFKYEKQLLRKLPRPIFITNSIEEAFDSESRIVLIRQESSAAVWVEQAANLAMKKLVAGMITGPLSKTEIQKTGMKDIGHTDILQRIAKVKFVRMGFIGSQFSVVLHSSHIPIQKVPDSIRIDLLNQTLQACQQMKKMLSVTNKVQVLGLNPHGGEHGLIGDEELTVINSWVKKHKAKCDGPIVPDAAFLPSKLKKLKIFMAMYHDQGLIPFKAIHGQDQGVHVTLGLPFIRTSVDHGTANDIFGKNKANPGSMIDAIKSCERFVK